MFVWSSEKIFALSLTFIFALVAVLTAVDSSVLAKDKSSLNANSANSGQPKNGGTASDTTAGKGAKAVSLPPEMRKLMDDYVLHEAKTLGGVEYTRDREFGRGKLSSCLSDCFVVLYLLEGVPNPGSKNSTQYMATFTYIAGQPTFLAAAQVGARGMRYVTLKSIGPDNIKLNSEIFLPKDNLENPTGKGHANYVIADKHLIEIP